MNSSAASSGLRPPFETNNIPVIFSTDDKFYPYLYVALVSLINHASAHNNYDINILHKGLTEYHQRELCKLQGGNISIRIVDVSEKMETLAAYWYMRPTKPGWHSESVYIRFFIPELFAAYDKIVFLDGDIIVCRDIADFYHIELGDKWLGAVQDHRRLLDNDPLASYFEEQLGVAPHQYFNAGILLMNLQQLNAFPFLDKCLEILTKLGEPRLQDQDVFNVLFNGHVLYLDYAWNCLYWHILHHHKELQEHCDPALHQRFLAAAANPNILHYAGKRKPWNMPELEYSYLFWRYARQTPCYEEIVYRNLTPPKPKPKKPPVLDVRLLCDLAQYSGLQRQYRRNRLRAFFSLGQKRASYRQASAELKERLRAVRRFLESEKATRQLLLLPKKKQPPPPELS